MVHVFAPVVLGVPACAIVRSFLSGFAGVPLVRPLLHLNGIACHPLRATLPNAGAVLRVEIIGCRVCAGAAADCVLRLVRCLLDLVQVALVCIRMQRSGFLHRGDAWQ